MIIVKQSHFPCSTHYIIVKSIHIIPNVIYQTILLQCLHISLMGIKALHYLLVQQTWIVAAMLNVTHRSSKNNCINICMWRAQSCTCSRTCINTEQWEFLCQEWHDQMLNKYSNSGKISLVCSYLKMKQNKKVFLLLFPNILYFTICLHKTIVKKMLCLSYFTQFWKKWANPH